MIYQFTSPIQFTIHVSYPPILMMEPSKFRPRTNLNTTSNDPKDQPFWQPRLKPAPLLQQTPGSGEEKNGGVSKGGTKLRVSFSPRLFGENQCIKTQIYRNFCQSIVRSKVGNFWAINGQSWVTSAPVVIRSWAECKKSSCLPLHTKLNTSLKIH